MSITRTFLYCLDVWSSTYFKKHNLPVPALLMPFQTHVREVTKERYVVDKRKWRLNWEKAGMDYYGYPVISGIFGGALSDTVEVSDLELKFDDSFTVIFGVGINNVMAQDMRIVSFLSGDSPFLSISLISEGGIKVSLGAYVFLTSNSLWSQAGKYTIIALVYNSDLERLILYKNGEVFDSWFVSITNVLPVTLSEIIIGGDKFGGSLSGVFSCLQVYDTLLEDHQVQVLRLCPNKYAPPCVTNCFDERESFQCGNDERTYKNMCKLRIQACLTNPKLLSARAEACKCE